VEAGAEGGEEGGLSHGGSGERRREEGREARRAAEGRRAGGWRRKNAQRRGEEGKTDGVGLLVQPGPVQAQGEDCFFSDSKRAVWMGTEIKERR
jgi:hypothetical protein